MCLLDTVERWSETFIQCASNTHLLMNNPLRLNGHLNAVHAVEYAAQAMAVHGGLLAHEQGVQPVQGLIVALRDINLYTLYLHDKPGSLGIEAEILMHSSTAMIYSFRVKAGEMVLADGRISVMNGTGITA